MKDIQNVLVAGANGTTGRIIIDLLKDSKEYEPIAMVRKEEQREQFHRHGVSTVLADLEEDLSDAVKGTDKVIFAAGSKGKNLIGVDQEGAKKLADESKNAGIEKFVMLSAMGVDDPSQSDDLQDYLKAKKNADDHLRSTGLNYSIVRPGRLTDNNAIGNIQLNEKLDHHGSIPRADVAYTLVEVLDDNVRQNETFEILEGEVPIKKAVL